MEHKRQKTANQEEELNHTNSKDRLDMTSGRVTAGETCSRIVKASKPKPPTDMSYTVSTSKCL